MSQGVDLAIEKASRLLRIIEAHGHTALIVGGAVRDRVMGRPVGDVDLATDLLLDGLLGLFPVYDAGTNRAFGTGVVRQGAWGDPRGLTTVNPGIRALA